MAAHNMVGILICLGVIVVGTLLTLVAMATPNWTTYLHHGRSEVSQGLFEACYLGDCLMIVRPSAPDPLLACRGLNVVAVMAGVISGFTALFWLIKTKGEVTKGGRWIVASSLTAVFAALLVVITLLVYVVKFYVPDKSVFTLGSSIYINCVGASLLLIGGLGFRAVTLRMASNSGSMAPPMVYSAPYPSSFCTYNMQQLQHSNNQGLVSQRPQGTVLIPPPAYTELYPYPQGQGQGEYTAHILRDLDDGQYTPGEVRKSAPGSTSI